MKTAAAMMAVALAAAGCAGGGGAGSGAPDGGLGGDVYSAPGADMVPVPSFGDNPGGLAMYEYVPEELPAGAPLVLVLHGCSQTARDMLAAGWNQLADERRFAVVYPEQSLDNNPIRCFNWAGEYGDEANLVRGQGENRSIASMVERMIAEYGVDPQRVYISGFSAGGAFVAVMLATWPDLFDAGAIQSGVPYRCATTVQGAYDCQQLHLNPGRKRSPAEWGALVRQAYPGYSGPYPRVSIWHGTADTFIVHHENMAELIGQWTDVHGIPVAPSSVEEVAGHEHALYLDGGRAAVESWAITGMGHAVPYGLDDPDYPCGPTLLASYYTDVNVCSTWRVARFFGLVGEGVGCPGGDCGGDPPGGGFAPRVRITSPGDGEVVSGVVRVAADVVDDVEVDRVEFFVDGALQVTVRAPPYAFEWATTAFGDGEHELRAVAYEPGGSAGDDRARAMVDNAGGGPPGFSGCAAAGRGAARGAGGLALALALALALSIAGGGRRRSRGPGSARRRGRARPRDRSRS